MNRDSSGLQDLLDREIESATALAALLEVERAALTGDCAAAVTAAAARKIELFAVIEDLEAQRRKLCDASGVSLSTGTPLAIAERWTRLLDVIAGCRLANEVNGYIINARRGQIGQLLQIIRGGAPATYGPQGRQQSASLRALARA